MERGKLTMTIALLAMAAAFLLPRPTTAWTLSQDDPQKILEHSPLAAPRAAADKSVGEPTKRKAEEEVKEKRWHWVERTVGKFRRQVKLLVNADKVWALLENGVLRISVGKLSESETKKKEAKLISTVSDGNDNVVEPTKKEL